MFFVLDSLKNAGLMPAFFYTRKFWRRSDLRIMSLITGCRLRATDKKSWITGEQCPIVFSETGYYPTGFRNNIQIPCFQL
jgi:hypothetical protein